jgi:hypothetical protein
VLNRDLYITTEWLNSFTQFRYYDRGTNLAFPRVFPVVEEEEELGGLTGEYDVFLVAVEAGGGND